MSTVADRPIVEAEGTNMEHATGVESGSATWLSRWMVGVAIVYLLLFANLAATVLMPARLTQFYPTFDAPVTSVAAQTTVDALLMFGLDLAVIAGVLLWASRTPVKHAVLVWLVIALEAIRGIADDLYLIVFRDYTVDAVYYGFIGLHLLIIVTGYLAYRHATTPTESA